MTIETAIKYLKTFFSNTPGDTVSLQDIYLSSNLSLSESKKNRKWLANKQPYLIKHGLVFPKYKGRMLSGLTLTERGKHYIGRISGMSGLPTNQLPLEGFSKVSYQTKLTLEEIMKAMPKLKLDHPEFEITFDVKLKNI